MMCGNHFVFQYWFVNIYAFTVLLTLHLIVTSERIDSNLSSIPCPYFHHCCHDFHLWMDFPSVRFSTSQLRYLKSVDFLGFSAKEDELILLDLVLEKAVRLNSFTLTPTENWNWSTQIVTISHRKSSHFAVLHNLNPTSDMLVVNFFNFSRKIVGKCVLDTLEHSKIFNGIIF